MVPLACAVEQVPISNPKLYEYVVPEQFVEAPAFIMRQLFGTPCLPFEGTSASARIGSVVLQVRSCCPVNVGAAREPLGSNAAVAIRQSTASIEVLAIWSRV